MNSDELFNTFREKLSGFESTKVAYSGISRRVLELSGSLNVIIYVKISTKSYSWGITKNTVNKIKDKKKPWCIILLYRSPNTGYVISPENYTKNTKDEQSDLSWPHAQGDFKISYRCLKGMSEFKTFNELFNILRHILSADKSISV
jgi:hypothetical protein